MPNKPTNVTRRQPTEGVQEGRPVLRPPENSRLDTLLYAAYIEYLIRGTSLAKYQEKCRKIVRRFKGDEEE